jgi:hypothetical protein
VGGVLQNDIDDTGDGIRTVLCPGAISQYLDSLDGNQGDRVEVERVRAQPDLCFQRNNRRRVLPLAIDQNQYVVRAHTAKLRCSYVISQARIGLPGKTE